MLAELYVENFALIENLRVEFDEGFNIISGETGAGKSLLTDAVGLLIGGRADKDSIGKGAKKALVEGTFVGPFRRGVLVAFNEAGFTINEEIVVSREINEAGSNLCRINGRRVSLAILKDLIPTMMNVHSQTEHFSFLREEKQLSVLDGFGDSALEKYKAKTVAAYSQYETAHKARLVLENRRHEGMEKLDFLEYRVKELSEIALQPGEDEILREKVTLMKTAAKRLEESTALYDQLNQGVESLYEAMASGQRLGDMDETVSGKLTVLTSAYYDIEDLRDTIGQYRSNIETEPQDLERAEDRLSRVERLKKKYQTDVEGLLSLLAESKAELSSFSDFDDHLEQLQKEENIKKEQYFRAAEDLTAQRKTVGKTLDSAIIRELQDLMLPHACFKTEVTDGNLSKNGKDDVHFLISMNRGEALKPLAKVASGGEISRILLAMKVILGKTDQVETMIFDEIDSGMGGKAAAKVGEKLELLAKTMQIFAVTHSPIVAAKADHHYHIEKTDLLDKTIVEIYELKGEEIKRELARMLSGDEASAASLAQAEALLAAKQN